MAMGFLVVLAVSVIVVVAILGWRVLNWVWLRPRKLEKQLRRQGFKGNSYKLLFGDFKELMALLKEAKSKPISLTHDIVPRVLPIDHKLLINHGRNYFIWLGPRPMVNIMDPKLIREILSKHNVFQKPKAANPLSKLIICGLVALDGEKWAKHRRLIDPAFHFDKLKHMLPAFYLSCIKIMEKWEKIVSKKDGSCELNVWEDLQTLSADVISRTAFGSSHEEGRRIFELQKEQAELLMEAARSIYIPGSRFLPTKRNKRMKEINRDVNASIMSIIHKRLKAKKPTENRDLLGMLLDLNYKDIEQHDNMKSGLSIDEVIDECKVFYFAGQETTANLLVWTMILLGQHQLWQEQARQEVLHVFGKNQPNHDGISHLKVISMILNEVLRLYPPAIVQRRMIHEETKLQDINLPAGTIIQVPILMLHHDKELWGDDANDFNPERFFEGVATATKGQLGSFIPFSGGPRICIGQNFAWLEAKMAVAIILQRFSFSLSASYSHAPHSVITLQPQHGAHLILHKL